MYNYTVCICECMLAHVYACIFSCDQVLVCMGWVKYLLECFIFAGYTKYR